MRKPRTFTFNFKAEFAGLVERGYKFQTIRGLRKDGKRPEPGDLAKLYTGLRTRNTRWLRDGPVVRCRAVRIDFSGNGQLILDGVLLSQEDRLDFAKADGFHTWDAMLKWFRDQYGALCNGSTWDGFCVEWQP